jgi:putative ABC transport system ATP-binding protein
MVILEDVSKHYGSGPSLISAIDHVSLLVEKGEFLILIGHSGSGKTTLLNLIAGMTYPDSGKIDVAGKDILTMKDADVSRFRSETIGFIFQFQSMVSSLAAIENVMLPSLFSTRKNSRDDAISMLEKVGLEGREKAYSHELSIGQQRRVAVARALIHKPDLLLCDEPTGDLDPETEQTIMGLITQANKDGATVIMATHNHDLRPLANRVMNLNRGKIAD